MKQDNKSRLQTGITIADKGCDERGAVGWERRERASKSTEMKNG